MTSNLEDFFLYEMQVLNYDKVIKSSERNKRFLELIKQTLAFKQPEQFLPEGESQPEKQQVKMVGLLVGPGLIWARARFELKTIQVNKYNKLLVEIHSKITEPIKLSKIQLRFNDNILNQDIEGNFILSKSTPIILERELYVSKENYSI